MSTPPRQELLLIIDRPSLVPPHKRILFGMATLAIWSLWLYLWLPLTTLLGWGIGGYLGYREMVFYSGYVELLHLLGWYALIVLILGGALVLWAIYNLARFRGRERRTMPMLDDIYAHTHYFRVAAETLTSWRNAKALYVEYNGDGVLQRVQTADERPA